MKLYKDCFDKDTITYSFLELADTISSEDPDLGLEIHTLAHSKFDAPPRMSELAIWEDLYNKMEELKEVLALPNLTNE